MIHPGTIVQVVAAIVVAGLVGLPLVFMPSPFLAWLAGPAFVVGVAGVLLVSVPLVTATASLALIEYALALVTSGAPVDLVTASGFGAALFLLLELVHLAGRIQDATVGRSVVATHVRSWLAIVALGAAASAALSIGGSLLRLAVAGTSLPLVVVASAVGALLTVAGVLVLLTRPAA
jgi:hypothetical protein